MASQPITPEDKAKHVWSIGSYADIAPAFLPIAARLVDAAGVGEGAEVLDVACGTGNVAVTAARRRARVTGLDLVPAMLEQARRNAEIAGVDGRVAWREGTASALPFEDDTFDVTLSCLGHMFAQPPEEAGRELVRVTRPGGRIGFTSWTPGSVVPAMAKALRPYLPEDPDPPEPPFLWGDPEVVEARLGDAVEDLRFETDTILSPAASPEHYWEKGTTESGLFILALEAVEEADRPRVREEVIGAVREYFDEGRNGVEMEYRLVTATAAA